MTKNGSTGILEENSLSQYDGGDILGILRLLLGRVRSLAVAQDDRGGKRRYGTSKLVP